MNPALWQQETGHRCPGTSRAMGWEFCEESTPRSWDCHSHSHGEVGDEGAFGDLDPKRHLLWLWGVIHHPGLDDRVCHPGRDDGLHFVAVECDPVSVLLGGRRKHSCLGGSTPASPPAPQCPGSSIPSGHPEGSGNPEANSARICSERVGTLQI